MIGNFILSLPILCLLGSTALCVACMWKVYWKEVHIQVHRVMKKVGLWKTGKGRWRWLAIESILYLILGAISVLISILSIMDSGEKFFAETVPLAEIIGTLMFSASTMIISLLIYGIDFSKVAQHLSNFFVTFFRKLLTFTAPIFLWIIFGLFVYKKFFGRSLSDWFSSIGSALNLSCGIASIIIMAITVIISIRDEYTGGI